MKLLFLIITQLFILKIIAGQQQPRFEKTVYEFKLSPNSSQDTVVGHFKLLNFQRGRGHSSLSSSLLNLTLVPSSISDNDQTQHLFLIDRDRMQIRTRTSLLNNKLKMNTLSFHLLAFNLKTGEQLAKCSILMHICTTGNRHSPEFTQSEYQVQMFESNAPGLLLLKVHAIDLDCGVNGQITYHFLGQIHKQQQDLVSSKASSSSAYSFSNLPLPFQIKSDTGQIYATKQLNSAHRQHYRINVLAIDNGQPQRRSSLTVVHVYILAQTQLRPVFYNNSITTTFYNVTVHENTDFTSRPVIFQVNASIASSSSSLVFSLAGSLNDLNTFEIDSVTGRVRLVSKLNWSRQSIYELRVIATDTQSEPARSATAWLRVQVQSEYDKDRSLNKQPVFTQPFYTFVIFQNVPVGSSVGYVLATTEQNKRRRKRIIYKINDVLTNKEILDQCPFSMSSNGTLYTNRVLHNSKTTSYEFYVSASVDGQSPSSSVKVKVRILDLNDQVPQFTKSHYVVNVSEDSSAGLPLLTLDVINSNNNNNNKDYDTSDPVQLQYSIDRIQTDDSKEEYDEDDDEEEAETLFELIKQINYRAFLTVRRSGLLNAKRHRVYHLQLKVMDEYSGLYSLSTVIINVKASYVYGPRFTRNVYKFKVRENASRGFLVGRIEANTDRNHAISYQLIDQKGGESLSSNSLFRMDLLNGQLFIERPLDRERFTTGVITLYATVTDQSSSSSISKRIDHAILQVHLLDINDNVPRFFNDVYQRSVFLSDLKSNDQEKQLFLYRVEAEDPDLDENGLVRYSIEQVKYRTITEEEWLPVISTNIAQLFHIDSETGVVYFDLLNHSEEIDLFLDQVRKFQLILKSQDQGKDVSLSSVSQLVLSVLEQESQIECLYEPYLFYSNAEQMASDSENILGEFRARSQNQPAQDEVSLVYKILDNQNQFALMASGKFNTVLLKKTENNVDNGDLIRLKVRVQSTLSDSYYKDCAIEVRLFKERQPRGAYFKSNSFRIVFNNYKESNSINKKEINNNVNNNNNELLSTLLPVHILDPAVRISFSILDPIGSQLVSLDETTGLLTFKPILNRSNNQLNVKFRVSLKSFSDDNDDEIIQEQIASCELLVLMLSDNLIQNSVTLELANVDEAYFLNFVLDRLQHSLLTLLNNRTSSSSSAHHHSRLLSLSNIHVFSVSSSVDKTTINVSLSVSYDYSNDEFMSGLLLTQLIVSERSRLEEMVLNSSSLQNNVLRVTSESATACALEPCLNYQQCVQWTRYSHMNSKLQHDTVNASVQFRSVYVRHDDYTCQCPDRAFTAMSSSVLCDLEINLCYSSPCGQHGICHSIEAGYVCVCEPGFTGTQCQWSLDEMRCCNNGNTEEQMDTSTRTIQTTLMISANETTTTRNGGIICANNLPNDEEYENEKTSFYVNNNFNSLFMETRDRKLCRGQSQCKNLILGGVLCDKCDDNKDNNEYYTEQCQLRTRHFNKDQEYSYFTLPGLRQRFRFTIRLTFATVQQNAILFFNGRLENQNDDFVSLEIRDSHLVFSYSLGGGENKKQINELWLRQLSVSDGEWRTLNIQYQNRNVTLQLDNDRHKDVDACQLARNKNTGTDECVRVNHFYQLPEKCSNQIEQCFRYLDLNGPLYFGVKPETKNRIINSYQGCISDVFIDEQLIDLNEHVLSNFGTESGCRSKVNQCNSSKCTKCQHLWSTEILCQCQSDDYVEESHCQKKLERGQSEVFSLAANGYLTAQTSTVNSNFDLEFYLKFENAKHNEDILLLLLLEEEKNIYRLYYRKSKLILEQEDREENTNSLIEMNWMKKNNYWTHFHLSMKLEQQNLNNNLFSVSLTVNRIYQLSVKLKKTFNNNSIIKQWFIGGSSMNNKKSFSFFSGCVKQIKEDQMPVDFKSVNATKGCGLQLRTGSIEINNNNSSSFASFNCTGVCFNNGICSISNTTSSYHCKCIDGFKGTFCQEPTKVQSLSITVNSTSSSECPAKWWSALTTSDNSSSHCGPCHCDQSRHFSPDCDKHTGQCQCQPRHYRQRSRRRSPQLDYCAECLCYLETSKSLQCDPLSGQCLCLSGVGVTGRQCNQCVSPWDELQGSECKNIGKDQCPRSFDYGLWWPRTFIGQNGEVSCAKGSVGKVTRKCHKQSAWRSSEIDLSQCESEQLSQLRRLGSSQSQLASSYEALNLIEQLYTVSTEADRAVDTTDELDAQDYKQNYFVENPFLDTHRQALYAKDLLLMRNWTRILLSYELSRAPAFLYLQEKHFLPMLLSTLSTILNKKYETKLEQLNDNNKLNNNGHFTELLISLDKYLNAMVQHHQNNTSTNLVTPELLFLVDYDNVQLFASQRIQGQAFAAQSHLSLIKFKLLTATAGQHQQHSSSIVKRIAFITLNSASTNFPTKMIRSTSTFSNSKQDHAPLLQQLSQFSYHVASNLLLLHLQESDNKEEEPFYLVVEFVLTNVYTVRYDSVNKKLVYRTAHRSYQQIAAAYQCVHLETKGGVSTWSTHGSRLISMNVESNTVKCSYDQQFEIYAVVLLVDETMLGLLNQQSLSSMSIVEQQMQKPVAFSTVYRVLMWMALCLLGGTLICLSWLRRLGSALTLVHCHYLTQLLLEQLLFMLAVNNGACSQVICQLTAILWHYLHLCSYSWLLLTVLHLYRMLTELRDINRVGSRAPLFYYLLGYGLPGLVVLLSAGLQQQVYTNYSQLVEQFDVNNGINNGINLLMSQLYSSSVYCWLNVSQLSRVVYALAVPSGALVFLFVIVAVLSYQETKRHSFKQTDLTVVCQSLLGACILLPVQCLVSMFQLAFVYHSGGNGFNNNSNNGSNNNVNYASLFQHLFLASSVCQIVLLFLLLVVLNGHNRKQLSKAWNTSFLIVNNEKQQQNNNVNNNNNNLNNSNVVNVNKILMENKMINKKAIMPIKTISELQQQQQLNNKPPNFYDLTYQKRDQVTGLIMSSQGHLIQQNNQNNSFSTTTTNGTIDNLMLLGNVNPQMQMQMLMETTTDLSQTKNNDTDLYTLNNNTNDNKQNLRLMGVSYSNGYSTNTNDEEDDDEEEEEEEDDEETTTNSDFQFDNNQRIKKQQQMINECDIVDIGKILKSRQLQSIYSSEKEMMNLSRNDNKYITSQVIDSDVYVSSRKEHKQPGLSMFWPNKVAECDTSFLDGSIVYSPTKLPYSSNTFISAKSNEETVTADNTNSNRNELLVLSSNSNSANNSNQNVYSNSTTSLILNSNTNLLQQSASTSSASGSSSSPNNNNHQQFNFIPTGSTNCSIVPILTHTGSVSSESDGANDDEDDNDSSHETRV